MLFKAKIRLYGEVHEIVHTGHLLDDATRIIEKKCGPVHRSHIVGNKIVAEVELGYEVEAEIVSNRKLPERKH